MTAFDPRSRRDHRSQEGRPTEPPSLIDLEGLDLEEVEDWISKGWAEATDGCVVEPDGVCPHTATASSSVPTRLPGDLIP
ncbi:MAG TPA: hypothetical protein VFD49_03065 [Candidatus Dormibacteraeota bacterium]|nr:hypothetical protein [Candidatus Dormibacteraeota bacterium]